MAARHEQIGQCADHDQAMRILLQSAVAHLGKAEHPLADPDRVLDPGPHFGLGAVFRPLDLIHDAAVAVAAIDEIPGLGSVLPDHRALAAVGLITPHAGLVAMQQLGQYRAVGDIGRRGDNRVDQLGAAVDPEMRRRFLRASAVRWIPASYPSSNTADSRLLSRSARASCLRAAARRRRSKMRRR
jgi:hypothetical protein